MWVGTILTCTANILLTAQCHETAIDKKEFHLLIMDYCYKIIQYFSIHVFSIQSMEIFKTNFLDTKRIVIITKWNLFLISQKYALAFN